MKHLMVLEDAYNIYSDEDLISETTLRSSQYKLKLNKMNKMQVLKSILLEKLKPNPDKKLIQKLQQMADKCFSKKIYLDNHIFMELIGELATNITEMIYGQETYNGVEGFTDEAQEYYNETYDQYETLFNNFAKIYPKI